MNENTEAPEVYTPEKHPLEEVPVAPAPYVSEQESTQVFEPLPQEAPTTISVYVEQPQPQPRSSGHGLRIALGTILVIVLTLGIVGFIQYRAAMRVVDQLTADGNTAFQCIHTLTDSVNTLDFATALDSAKQLDGTVSHMRGLISTRQFDIASKIPKYGKDIITARELMDIILDADEEALIPLLQALLDNPVETMYSSKTGFDTESLYELVDAVDAAFPVAEKDLDALSNLDSFAIPQLREVTEPLIDNITVFSKFFDEAQERWGMARAKVDELVARDGSGVIPHVLSLVGTLLGEEADNLYAGIVSYAKSMLTGVAYVAETVSGSIDWTPVIKLIFGDGDASQIDWLPIIMQIIGNAQSSEGGEGGFNLFSILGLLFGSDDGNPGLFELLGPLMGGDKSDGGGTGGFDLFSILGPLFGGDESDNSDSSSLIITEDPDLPDAPEEFGEDFDFSSIFELIIGGGDSDNGDSSESGDNPFGDFESILELLFGGTDISLEEPTSAA